MLENAPFGIAAAGGGEAAGGGRRPGLRAVPRRVGHGTVVRYFKPPPLKALDATLLK